MKKILILMFVAAFLVNCTNKTYTLEGIVESADLNGVSVYIKTFDGENWIDAVNVTIENQKFILKGILEEPLMAYLAFNDAEKQVRGSKMFVLENVKTKFVIDENMEIKMSGSDANNLLQAFDDELESTEKRNEVIVEFAKENVNTLPGTLVFLNTYYYISLEDKIAVLDLMDDTTKSNTQIQAIVKQTENEKKTAPGQKYINFTLPDAKGNMLSLSDLVGKTDYLLIDFWASWCGPCLRSFPELTKFYNENKGKRFEILGVSLDDAEENWKKAILSNKLEWKHVSDLKKWKSEAGQLYAVNSIPCTILIDKNGVLVGRNMSLAEIAQLIDSKNQ